MASKASKAPSLSYFPAELTTPVVVSSSSSGSNTFLQITILILVLLILGVFIGGMVYVYCFADENATVVAIQKNNNHDNKDEKKKVTFAAGAPLEEISDEDLLELLKSDGTVELDPVVICFVSPTCGHCNVMKPALKSAALKSKVPIKTATYTSEKKSPVIAQALQHLNIAGMPTIYRIENGTAKEYQGDRSEESLIAFAS